MAAVFLDTNYFIDIISRKQEENILDSLIGFTLYVSALSIHVYCYVYKLKIPNDLLSEQLKKITCVDLNKEILAKSLIGPTEDLEDNIQLHSASTSNCNYFLTNDRDLLKMKFFGQTAILEKLPFANRH